MTITQMFQIACVGTAFAISVAIVVAAIRLAVGDRKENKKSTKKEENK